MAIWRRPEGKGQGYPVESADRLSGQEDDEIFRYSRLGIQSPKSYGISGSDLQYSISGLDRLIRSERRNIDQFVFRVNDRKVLLQMDLEVIVGLKTGLVNEEFPPFFEGAMRVVQNPVLEFVVQK